MAYRNRMSRHGPKFSPYETNKVIMVVRKREARRAADLTISMKTGRGMHDDICYSHGGNTLSSGSYNSFNCLIFIFFL